MEAKQSIESKEANDGYGDDLRFFMLPRRSANQIASKEVNDNSDDEFSLYFVKEIHGYINDESDYYAPRLYLIPRGPQESNRKVGA